MEHYCDISVISSSEISMGHLSCDGRCGDVAINRDNMVSTGIMPPVIIWVKNVQTHYTLHITHYTVTIIIYYEPSICDVAREG